MFSFWNWIVNEAWPQHDSATVVFQPEPVSMKRHWSVQFTLSECGADRTVISGEAKAYRRLIDVLLFVHNLLFYYSGAVG